MQILAASFPVLTVMALLPLAGAGLLALVAPLRAHARTIGLLFFLAALIVGVWAACQFDAAAAHAYQLTETQP